MKRIQFNTGRMYSAQGQKIVAILHDDGIVSFMDHSRMIGGEFELGQDCPFNQVEVMRNYDGNNYHMSVRAMNGHSWES